MAQQVLDPARGREPAHLVRLDEQLGESAPQLERLPGGEIHRELVQQADELTHVRRSRDLAPGASQRSNLTRVALRGIAPCRKSRTPFGLMPTSRATPRRDRLSASRPSPSRNSGTGKVGTMEPAVIGAWRPGAGALARPFLPSIVHDQLPHPTRDRSLSLAVGVS